jgi:hypothetical protein
MAFDRCSNSYRIHRNPFVAFFSKIKKAIIAPRGGLIIARRRHEAQHYTLILFLISLSNYRLKENFILGRRLRLRQSIFLRSNAYETLKKGQMHNLIYIKNQL